MYRQTVFIGDEFVFRKVLKHLKLREAPIPRGP
jgi:hypothetical protein